MRIGILGGTFDPVHLGHLILAEEAKEQASLDQVILLPTKVSPFKLNIDMADDKHRLRMAELAVEKKEGFSVSDFEIDLNCVSYTINTLRALKGKLTGESKELFFILGTDAFLEIEKWYKSEELLREFSFIVGSRPGYRNEELNEFIAKLNRRISSSKKRETHEQPKETICKINNKLVEVSSTDLKKRLRRGEKITDLVSKEVEEYINEWKLYR